MPESQLRQRVRERLRKQFPQALVIGWPGNFWSGAGWPDLLYLEWPLLLGLEVKQGRRSKPSPVQGSRHQMLREHHVPVFVIHTPQEAVDSITQLKEKLPMAFDPALLAELEAALGDKPATDLKAEPEPVVLDVSDGTPDTSANGAAVFEPDEAVATFEEMASAEGALDPDQPAPDIEDLTAAIVANEEIAQAQADAALEVASEQLVTLTSMQASVDKLTEAIYALLAELQSDPTEAPKRGRRRAS